VRAQFVFNAVNKRLWQVGREYLVALKSSNAWYLPVLPNWTQGPIFAPAPVLIDVSDIIGSIQAQFSDIGARSAVDLVLKPIERSTIV
jgi:hypothetical protein